MAGGFRLEDFHRAVAVGQGDGAGKDGVLQLVGRVRGGSRKDIRLDVRQGDRTVAVGNRNFPRDERRSDDFGIRGPRMKIVGGHLLQGNRSVGGIGLHFAGSQIFTVD